MLDLSPEALKEPTLGETAYFQPATGTSGTTKWQEYESKLQESSLTGKQESKAQDGISLETLSEGPDLQQGRSMAIKLVNEGGDNSPIQMNLDDWKYPKIPINEVYNRSHDKIVSVYGFKKFLNTGYVHFGLVQIAIKPLMSDGLGDSIIVCLTDARIVEFEQSLLSVVQSDLSQGPFYFNCCPDYTIPWKDREILTLNVMKSGVTLALTYRVVCKASTDITLDVRGSIRRETTYFQPMSTTGIERTTTWDKVQFPESWTNV
uniref:Movement protein n=1 Tax=Chenopodium quinoa TaxID=63459 RepID=A0A803LTW6_CHEQI